MYSLDFIAALPDDPLDGAMRLVEHFYTELVEGKDEGTRTARSNDFIRAMKAMQSYASAKGLNKLKLSNGPALSDMPEANVTAVIQWFGEVRKNVKVALAQRTADEASQFFDGAFKNGTTVILTDEEFAHIQNLVDQLRKFLSESTIFSKEHRKRLLAKLEKLQAEFHKTMSNVDRFWGFMSEAGIAFGKFGEDAKPFVDRVNEILSIIFLAQHRIEQLPRPADLPRLPDYRPPESQVDNGAE